jgi:hypothetical protein
VSDRLAAAIAGTLSIPLIAVAGAMAGGTGAGVAAAWLLAASPLHVFYSREGRPYALLTLITTLLVIAFLTHRRRLARGIGWSCAISAPYLAISAMHVLAGAALAAAGCAAFEWRMRRLRRPSAGGPASAPAAGESGARALDGGGRGVGTYVELGIAALAGLALLALLYGPYPRPPQDGSFPAAPGRILLYLLNGLAASPFWNRSISPLTPWFAAAALAGVAALARRRPRAAIALAALACGTAGTMWAAMAITDHYFTLRYFTPVLPAFLVLAATGVAAAARGLAAAVTRLQGAPAPPHFAPLVAGAAVAALVACNLGTALDCPYQKADWRGAARAIAVATRGRGTVIAANRWSATCITFYLGPRLRRIAVVDLDDVATPPPDVVAAAAALGDCWLLHGGYPRRAELKRWMRSFPALWQGREESIGVYRCGGNAARGLGD